MSSAAKKQTRGAFRQLLGAAANWLQSSIVLWRIALAGTLTAAVIAISLGIWQKVRPHVETQPEYLVAAESIEITQSPEWIHANVKAEVIRDAGLSAPLSILDQKLPQRLTQAFALHPWIAAVGTIKTSYPAHVTVELKYRVPVAMVEVHGGLLPIDRDGMLLPTEDFSPQEALKYPRVAGVESSPLGPLGTRWGDPTIEAAAKLASILQPVWSELQLHHIERLVGSDSRKQSLEIITLQRTCFVWGSAPGEESTDEPRAETKLKQLQHLQTKLGALDATPPEERDLRQISVEPVDAIVNEKPSALKPQ